MGGVGQMASLISHHLVAQVPALALAGEVGCGAEEREALQLQLWLGLLDSDVRHGVGILLSLLF